MQNTELFLDIYKKFEQILRSDKSMSVLDYEGTLQPEVTEKLKLCRIIRNYAQHNSDYIKFISVTSHMISFIEELTKELEKEKEKAGDRTKRVPGIEEKMTLKDICAILAKSKVGWACVIDSTGKPTGVITQEELVAAIAKAGKLTTRWNICISIASTAKNLKNAQMVNKETKLEGYDKEDKLIVVDPKTGKYEGIVIWN